MKDLFCFFRCHTFLSSQFYKFVNVSLSFVRCLWVNDCCSGDIESAFSSFLIDFFFVSDEDDLGNSLFQNLISCLESSHVLCFWQYDSFDAFFGSFFE